MAPYSVAARARSTRVIDPLTMSNRAQVLVAGVGEDVDQGRADGDDVERWQSSRAGPGRGVVHSPASYSATRTSGDQSGPSEPG